MVGCLIGLSLDSRYGGATRLPADIVAVEPSRPEPSCTALTRAAAGLVVLRWKPLPAALRD